MKKATLLFTVTMIFFGLSAQAAIGTDDCPIKNLQKGGLYMHSPGLAFFPKGHPMNTQRARDVVKPNEVYREN